MPALPGKIELELPDQPFHIGEPVFRWREYRSSPGTGPKRPEELDAHGMAQRPPATGQRHRRRRHLLTRRGRRLKTWGYRGKETRR
jgi:hypothetical protein